MVPISVRFPLRRALIAVVNTCGYFARDFRASIVFRLCKCLICQIFHSGSFSISCSPFFPRSLSPCALAVWSALNPRLIYDRDRNYLIVCISCRFAKTIAVVKRTIQSISTMFQRFYSRCEMKRNKINWWYSKRNENYGLVDTKLPKHRD